MGKADYPTEADLKNEILSTGIIDDLTEAPVSRIPWATHLLAARQAVETATGRRFKAVVSTRKFDAPDSGTVLKLDADLVSITSVSVGGQPKTLDTDYFGLPTNAPSDGKPYTLIEFACWLPQGRRNIEVTGPWGFSLEVPELAWDAILADAALRCVPALETAISNGLKSIKLGQDSYTFGENGVFSVAAATWTEQRQAAIDFYKRVVSAF